LAVSPLDSAKLIAGSMVYGAKGLTMETFRSNDGGYNWRSTLLPTGSGSLLGDVQARFDAYGRAFMTGLGSEVGPSGAEKNGLFVFGSSNAGETFNQLAFLQTPSGHSYDHEQLAIDTSNSRYSGRIYMTLLYTLRITPQLNGLGLLWSADHGHTFHGPVEVSRGWSFNSRPVVLSDGTVLFPLIHTAHLSDVKQTVQLARSNDGGKTFATPILVGTRVGYGLREFTRKVATGDYAFDLDSVPQFAAGARASAMPNNVYGIWSDVRSGVSRLLFSKSTDAGKHWTSPRTIFTTNDTTDAQYQPSIAVNALGVIGISWFNGSSSRNTVSEMFAISTDGARTFSTPTVISSIASPLRTPAGSRYQADDFPDPHGLFLGFSAPGRRYPSGGDYMDLVYDSGGSFHPIWIDARNGLDQIWTATVLPHSPGEDPAGLSKRNVTTQMKIEFGVGRWDDASHTLSVPARLHNVSKITLYPPFTVAVTMTTNPYDKRSKPEVTVLNADNGKSGVGAAYTFSAQTLGNLGRLAPGADTSSRIIKVRIAKSGWNPVLLTSVQGYVAAKQ
jgi:hypothetical protein